MLPVTGAGLTIGGLTVSALQLTFWGIAIAVIGGALVTAAKFLPRIALDPQPVGVDKGRLQLTVQGQPVRRSGVGEETNKMFLPFTPATTPGGRHHANETDLRTAARDSAGGRHFLENLETRPLDAVELRRRLHGGAGSN